MSARFATIVADPPWAYPGAGGHLKSSAAHRPNSSAQNIGATSAGRYGAMTMPELAALRVTQHAADNSHLYLWTTNAFVCEAHQLARDWGFRPITLLTWGKVKGDGSPSMKIGHYYRGATEHVVFAVRGSLNLATSKAFPTLMLWPRTPGHSIKPEQFFMMVEEASPGPYLELFARQPRMGWSQWGDQVVSDIDMLGGPSTCPPNQGPINAGDVEDVARALFEARFPQYGEDGFDGAGEWWRAKCREQAALIMSRLTAPEGEHA